MSFVGMVCSLGIVALGITCILLWKAIDTLEERLELIERYLMAKNTAESFIKLRNHLTRNEEVMTYGFKGTEIH